MSSTYQRGGIIKLAKSLHPIGQDNMGNVWISWLIGYSGLGLRKEDRTRPYQTGYNMLPSRTLEENMLQYKQRRIEHVAIQNQEERAIRHLFLETGELSAIQRQEERICCQCRNRRRSRGGQGEVKGWSSWPIETGYKTCCHMEKGEEDKLPLRIRIVRYTAIWKQERTV